MAHSSASEVATIVNASLLLLQIELDPVVKSRDLMTPCFSNEHMLKATRIHGTVNRNS